MEALVTVLVLAVLVLPVLLLERTHRRTDRLSRMPFGLDLAADRDIARTVAEIDAIRTGRPGPGTCPRMVSGPDAD